MALIIGVVVAILAVADQVSAGTTVNATLAILALLAFGQIRTKSTLESSVAEVRQLADAVSIATGPAAADNFFGANTSEMHLLDSARSSVLLVQETGSLVVETFRHQMLSVLRRGGTVRMVTALSNEHSATMLSFRNANLFASDLVARRNMLQGHLRNLAEQAGEHSRRLEIRSLRYPVDATYILTDLDDSQPSLRRGLVRLAGFHVSYPYKLDFEFDGANSPRVAKHYETEFAEYFLSADKVILLEGAPRSGKTTLLKNLVGEVAAGAPVFAALSVETRSPDSGERDGFALEVTGSDQSIPFAKRLGDRNYETFGGAWTDLIPKVDEALLRGDVIVLDEIGPLQLREPGFLDCVRRLHDNPSATLIASISEGSEKALEELKRHPRASVRSLTVGNRAMVEKEISKELRASLRSSAVLRGIHASA